MRDIPMALSANSSSSSQQPANSNSDYENKQQQSQQQGQQQQSSLINEISTLQNRLRELDDGNHAMMNRPRSHSSLMGSGREPPQGGESLLVNQLRKELSKMEHEKADLELTLMNQMSSLAYENQTTIDSLHARLAQSEKLVESLQQQQHTSNDNNKPSSTSHLELQRLRKTLNDEKHMRRALEEERDARHQEVERTREERDACEKENATMKQELQHVKQEMSELKYSNSELTNQVKILQAEKEEAHKIIEALQSSKGGGQQQSLISDLQAKHKATIADLEKSHQGQMSEMKQSYQQRCSQLEKEMAQKFDSKKPNGVGSLHNKIAAVEAEKEDLEQQIAELTECLEQEQAMNQALEQSLEEHAQNSDKLWYSLEESQKRCKVLEEELSEQFEEGHEKGDLRKENEMLSNQIAAIHEQCVSEQEKSSKLKATLDAERSTNSKLRLSLRQHQQRYEELNRNLHRNHSGIGMVNGKAEKEKKQLSNQLAQVQEELAKEKAKSAELEEAVAEHQRIIEEQSHSTAGRRQSDLGALENAQLELQSVLNSYQSDMERLDRKVKQAEQQVAERNRQNQRLEVEINEERRIRKSLTAQLAQAKMANNRQVDTSLNSSFSEVQSTDADESNEAEVQRLRKENARLSEEVKMRTRMGDTVDPAEVEFLRKQNKLLGNGLHAEEVKELEKLREKTKALDEEVSELRNSTQMSQLSPSRSNLVLQNTKSELTQLRKQNAELLDELQAVKQELASSIEKGPQQQTKQWGENISSPPRPGSRRASAPLSPSPRVPQSPKPSTEHSTSNTQTPPLSPPLTVTTKKNHSSKQESPRTPVRGIVESFEQRISISRSNSSASLAAMSRTNGNASLTEAAIQAAFSQPQSQVHSSEVDDLQRELHEERATVQDLRNKLNSETSLVENLRSELARLEETDAKRAQLEKALESSDQDILNLEAHVKELESRAMDYGDIQEAMEQYRVTVKDLQSQLNVEAEQVEKLKSQLSTSEQSETDRSRLQHQLQDREAEVLRLRARVSELEDMMLEAGGASEALEQEKRKCRDLQSNLDTKLELVSTLRETLSNMEEMLEQEKSGFQDLQSQFEAQSEVVTTLRDELTRTDSLLEEEKKKASSMQSQLNDESVVVARLREELADMEAKIHQEKSSARNLQQNLSSESDLVSSLRNEISRMDGIEAAHAKLKTQVLEQEQENKRLRFQVGELEVLLSNAESKASDSSEVEELKSELAQADEAKRGYERKLFDVRAEMEVLSGEIANMGTALQDSEFQNQKLRDEASSYKASIETLEQTKRDDEDLIERLQTELGAARMGLERSLDELERTKGSGDDKEQRNIAAMQRDRAEIDRLTSDLAAAKQALDINVEEMEKLNKCVKNADASRMIAVRQSHSSDQHRQEEIEELRSELAAKNEASKNHDEEVQRLRSQVAALQQELGEAMTYVEEMKEMIAKLQNAHHSELEDAQKDAKRPSRLHGAEMNTLKVELTKNQMSRADMEREHLKQVKDLEMKMDMAQTEADKELREKERELHQLQFTISRKDEEIRQLEKEREQICSSMNSISTNRKDEMDDLQEELLNLKAKTASQTREIQALKMQLEEHDYRESEFQRLNERIEDLESEIQNIPRKAMPVGNNSGVEIMKAENKMLRDSIRELTMERRTLQEKLEAHLAEKTSSRSTQVLRERNAALKKEVERLTKRLKKMEHSMTRFTI